MMDKDKFNDISEMKCKLVEECKRVINSGLDSVNTQELGEVIDMIKDLSEVEKNCNESEYYEQVVSAMDNTENERYGYNSRRYASGRYAPKGRGMVTGYHDYAKPFIDQMPYIEDYLDDPAEFRRTMNERRGYYDNDTRMMSSGESDYGKAYHNYRNAKRHYTETHSQSDKDNMTMHANEHVMNTIATLRDVYKDSDPDLRKRMKEDFTKLIGEMT